MCTGRNKRFKINKYLACCLKNLKNVILLNGGVELFKGYQTIWLEIETV